MLASLGLLLIGSVVILKRPRLPAARALFLFCHGALYCLVVSAVLAADWVALEPTVARWLYQINIVGMALVAISLVQLMSWFPEPPFGNRIDALLRHGIVVVAAPLLLAELFDLVFQATFIAMYLSMGVTLVLLIRGFLRSKGPVQRLQTRWMMWGFAVPALTLFITSAPALFFPSSGQDHSETIFIVSCIAGPVAIAVAVLKHRLMDIDVVIRRTLVGAVVVSAFLFAFHLAVAVFAGGVASPTVAGGSSFMPVFVTAVIFTFVLAPVQQLLFDNLDRLFFRNRHHHHQALAELVRKLARIQVGDQAAQTVIETVTRAMDTRCVVIAMDPDQGAGSIWSNHPVEVPRDAQFWSAIRSVQEPRLRETGQRDTTHLDAWMATVGLDVVVAMRVQERFMGFLACSGPRDGKLLEIGDIRALHNLAASVALALSHARAFEALRLLNQQLEVRVEERTSELERTRIQLYQSEKMASVGLLAAGVAHELNTPLGAVLSSSQRLGEVLGQAEPEALPPQVGRLAALCAKAARRAADIVQNLRDFSRPSQKDPEIADLGASVTSTMLIMETTLRHAGITLELDLEDDLRLLCYPALVNQVIANLALNAVQAMEPGGTLRVSSARSDEGGALLTFQDTGPGIPAQVQNRIFEPFFTTKGAAGGTGLGLALTFNIVVEHGGTIQLDPSYTDGARFVVELPRRGRMVAPSPPGVPDTDA